MLEDAPTDLAPTPQPQPAVVQWQGVKSDVFEASPLAEAYWNVRHELKERDPKGKHRKWHDNVALWAAWESHKGHVDTKTGKGLLERLGLPKTQKGLAQLIGINVRTLRGYDHKYGEFSSMARTVSLDKILARYDASALHALGVMASTPDYRTAPDRKTFLAVRGMLTPKGDAPAKEETQDMQVQVYLPDNGESSTD